MTEHDESVGHITISPAVFYLLIGAAGLGGLGGGSFLGPQLEKTALQACFDNSQKALSVAAQHGEELNQVRAFIENRTLDRWTAADQRNHEREQDKRDAQQDRRLDLLERQLQ